MRHLNVSSSRTVIMPHHTSRVYFGLFGESFDPNTASIGIAPTQTTLRSLPSVQHTSWQYSTTLAAGELIDINQLASVLIDRLSPHANKIREAMQMYKLEAILQVVITFSADEKLPMPIIGFDLKVLSFLSSVGASIDIDIYRGVPQ